MDTFGSSVLAQMLSIFLIFSYYVSPTIGNQMDPHMYPTEGPFFEGWYMRIIDIDQSFGWLFGRVLPSKDSGRACSEQMKHMHSYPSQDSIFGKELLCSGLPLVYSSLLLNPSKNIQKLQPVTGFFPTNEYKITEYGKPVKHNPDDRSPPQFEAHIGKNVSFIVNGNGTQFHFEVGHHILSGETSAPVPWGPNGEGPEGILEKLPLPIHWFVYSLRSDVTRYTVQDRTTGKVIKGGSKLGRPVIAHMEKNWGASFPKAWVWAEGVDIRKNVSFSFSSGILTIVEFDVKAQLSGYRNPSKGIHCSFSPLNSVHSLSHDGCAGTARLEVSSVDCRVVFDMKAKPDSFSSCLFTPQTNGFLKGCVESYTAVANITVYQRHGIHEVIVDEHTIGQAALEFGEEFMCNSTCPNV